MATMDYSIGEKEEDYKKIGWVTSIIIHLVLLLLIFPYFFSSKQPIPGQTGILVKFGIVDGGLADSEPQSDVSDQDRHQENQESTPPPAKSPSKPVANAESKSKKIVVDKKSPVPLVDPSKKEESKEEIRAKAKEAEAEKAKKEKMEKEAAEARKKRDFEQKKAKFGSVFSSGGSDGNQPGDQGDPKGQPDAEALKSIAKGSGRVGGGLSNRGVIFEPTITENSQKSGTVVINICVDKSGKVISTKFTQKGSTTTDASLVDVAKRGAQKYKFSSSEIEKQCGTVTVRFIVK